MIEDSLRENNQNLEFTEWEIVPITVGANEWEWNSSLSQWEAVYTLPGLTNFIYEDGAVLGMKLIHISEPTRQAEISYAVF